MTMNDIVISDIYSWNIFLLLCAVPSLVSCICMSFMPESPKFLMTVGRNQKALGIFQRVYACNSGKSAELYPVICLSDITVS